MPPPAACRSAVTDLPAGAPPRCTAAGVHASAAALPWQASGGTARFVLASGGARVQEAAVDGNFNGKSGYVINKVAAAYLIGAGERAAARLGEEAAPEARLVLAPGAEGALDARVLGPGGATQLITDADWAAAVEAVRALAAAGKGKNKNQGVILESGRARRPRLL